MGNVQIIRTPSGEELVVLPRADYDALLAAACDADEDADDLALYDARKSELTTGECSCQLKARSVSELRGILARPGRAPSLGEMEDASAEGAAGGGAPMS